MNYIFFIVFLYIFFGFLLYIFQRRIIFNKSGKPKAPEHYTLEKTKEICIKTVDNISLLAWFHEGDKNKPILVYFHGNSFDIGERAYRIKRYNDAGFSTLLVSWRGFSGNDGNPTEENLYLDGNATIDWVLKNTKFKIEDIVNYGESLGSGVAVELNLKYNFLCTVLEAPFTSIADVANKRYKIYPTKFLVKDKFDNVRFPLLLITIEYEIISLVSLIPFPFTSETVADFVIFILGSDTVFIIVGSLVVLPVSIVRLYFLM